MGKVFFGGKQWYTKADAITTEASRCVNRKHKENGFNQLDGGTGIVIHMVYSF